MKKFLIVGANFSNKGAQSMLFVLTDQLTRRSPNCEIYFATDKLYPEDQYKFKRVHYSPVSKKIALRKIDTKAIKFGVKEIGKAVLGRGNTVKNWFDLNRIISQINLMIDISGFCLGEKWPVETHEDYLDNIRLAKLYNIPIIIMPQSFGPFNYDFKRQFLIDEIRELLPYANVIYAREEEGYNLLRNMFKLQNVRKSYDIVLQNDKIFVENIFVNPPQINLPSIDEGNAIAVIPNNHCFENGDSAQICHCYRVIIDEILSAGKQVYIFHHSREDFPYCKVIYDMYKTDVRVHMLENNFSCIEYNEFVKKFQFIICSRFHGIVHAYCNGIPAIILGWAVKYKELTEITMQSQYMFDITNGSIADNSVKEIVNSMLSNYSKESVVIREKVEAIQQESCFEIFNKFA